MTRSENYLALSLLTISTVWCGAWDAYADSGINELFFSHPLVFDGTKAIVEPGRIERIDLSTDQPSDVVSDLTTITPMGLATDAAGNLYYGNETFGPLTVDLFKRTPDGAISSLGTVVDASGGFVSFPAFDVAVNPTTNELFFSHPQVFDVTKVIVEPGRIEKIDLSTGQRSTVVSGLDTPMGLAIDAAGNLYYGNGTFGPLTIELFERTPDGTISSLGTVVDASGGFVSFPAFDIAVNRATYELFFTHPLVFDGQKAMVEPGRIKKIDLSTYELSTVESDLDTLTGLTTDATGNLYYGNETFGPLRVYLFKRTPVGTISSLGTVVDASAGFVSLPAFDLGYDPGQRIYLDWGTQLDKTFEKFVNNSDKPPSVRWLHRPMPSPIVPFFEAPKDGIQAELQSIVHNSGFDMPIVDSRKHSPPPPKDAVRVRFAPDGDGLLGKAYEGVDPCNKRKNDNVAVFGNPNAGDSLKLMAETIAHEAGHALGLRHMDPFEESGIEVMDYREPLAAEIEAFTQGIFEITEGLAEPQPTPTGDYHNPIYHIRAYSFGESRDDLEFQGVTPGETWDIKCDPKEIASSARRVSFLNIQFNGDIHNLAVQQQIGQVPASLGDTGLLDDPKWETIIYVGTINPSDVSHIEILSRGRFPIGLVGSSTVGNELDLFFGFGTPINPILTFDPSTTGTLTGSIFQFLPNVQTPSVVGSFTIKIDAIDSDGDGIADDLDNCVLDANGTLIPDAGGNSQLDTDGDNYGNICDPDFNNDLTVNAADLAYMKSVFFSSDPDADLNGDGAVNAADLAILKLFFFKPPGPSGLVP